MGRGGESLTYIRCDAWWRLFIAHARRYPELHLTVIIITGLRSANSLCRWTLPPYTAIISNGRMKRIHFIYSCKSHNI